MLSISQLLLFIGASVLLILAPGPDIIFTITQGVAHGKQAGMVTALGLAMGNLVHTTAAALGLSVIFRTSMAAFTIVKIAGALYLFYLAFQAIRHRNDPLEEGEESSKKGMALFLKGFLMNVLNPKVALFFLAFLPQFIPTGSSHGVATTFLLGGIFIILVIVIFGTLGLSAGWLGTRFLHNIKAIRAIRLSSAGVFITLGVKLALMER